MKLVKQKTVVAGLVCIAGVVWAQPAPRLALVEVFTSITCSACASVEPLWYEQVYEVNKQNLVVVAYHLPIPAPGDPFYSSARTHVDQMMNFYGINFTPSARLNGRALGTGSSAGHLVYVTSADIEQDVATGSPIAIRIIDRQLSGAQYQVVVEVEVVEAVPAGSYVLRVAAVERYRRYRWIVNPTLYDNHHVFRGFLTPAAGKPIALSAVGGVVRDTFYYRVDTPVSPAWLARELYIAAWVQNPTTKLVLNAARSLLVSQVYIAGLATQAQSHSVQVSNTTSTALPVRVWCEQLSGSALPSGWTGVLWGGGTSVQITDTLSFSVGAASTGTATISIYPSGTPGKGRLECVVHVDENQRAHTEVTVLMLAGITDLVVNNAGSPTYMTRAFPAGFTLARRNSWAILTLGELMGFINSGEPLRGVDAPGLNIYYSVPWTVPAFTDKLVQFFVQWLQSGGRLFVCGQDVGWDVWDVANGASSATPAIQSFYTNYLRAKWIRDEVPGTGSSTMQFAYVGANSADTVYGALAASGQIKVDSVYGMRRGGYYPDFIRDTLGSVPVFYYYVNGSQVSGGVAGVRFANELYKVVYLGFGLEMLADSTYAAEVVRITHDWFWRDGNILTDAEFDAKLRALTRPLYPNPASRFVVVPALLTGNTRTLLVYDGAGRIVMKHELTEKSRDAVLNVAHLPPGIYYVKTPSNTSYIGTFIKR